MGLARLPPLSITQALIDHPGDDRNAFYSAFWVSQDETRVLYTQISQSDDEVILVENQGLPNPRASSLLNSVAWKRARN